MEVISSIELILENAYARLFKWTQRECRRMTHETPEIGISFITKTSHNLKRSRVSESHACVSN